MGLAGWIGIDNNIHRSPGLLDGVLNMAFCIGSGRFAAAYIGYPVKYRITRIFSCH